MGKNEYENAPADIVDAIEQAEVIPDFLPPPDQLVLKEETVRVTLNLNKKSVDFFKLKARENGVPYQRMIRLRYVVGYARARFWRGFEK